MPIFSNAKKSPAGQPIKPAARPAPKPSAAMVFRQVGAEAPAQGPPELPDSASGCTSDAEWSGRRPPTNPEDAGSGATTSSDFEAGSCRSEGCGSD